MLSYQHIFHAGNHADLLKHYVLTFVLDSLNKKDKPYTFFDTHSASGIYDLLDNRVQKTGEAEKGVLSIIQENDSPVEMGAYLALVKNFNKKQLYPGSPIIEQHFLRNSDVLVLSELHPQEITNLKNNIKKYSKQNGPAVQVHNRNGWEMLNALTPPKTKRGAVLIDPSYEESKDYIDAAKTILSVNKKWSNGIILLWYPLLNHRSQEIDTMINTITEGCRLNNSAIEICNLQLIVNDKNAHKEVELEEFLDQKDLKIKNPPRLYGSGILVINAPWKLEESAQVVINYLTKKLYE